MDNWEKFLNGFKRRHNEHDIIIFTYILMHPYCNIDQINKECGYKCDTNCINFYVKDGLIKEDDGHYYC